MKEIKIEETFLLLSVKKDMVAPVADKDAKNTADLYFASREHDIGTLVEPKANEEVQAFVREHILTTGHFTAAIDDPVRFAELVTRKEAFAKIPSFLALCRDLAQKNNAGIDKKSPESVRAMLHDCLREVRTLMQMYEAARTKGPAINADGHHRANGATANAIRLNVGGLASFLSHGEPTAVSAIVVSLNHQRAAAAAALAAAAVPHSVLPTKSTHPARTDPPAQRYQCGYCGKGGHTGQDCRLRQREEGNRDTRRPHPPAPPGGGPVDDEFARFQKWRKENP